MGTPIPRQVDGAIVVMPGSENDELVRGALHLVLGSFSIPLPPPSANTPIWPKLTRRCQSVPITPAEGVGGGAACSRRATRSHSEARTKLEVGLWRFWSVAVAGIELKRVARQIPANRIKLRRDERQGLGGHSDRDFAVDCNTGHAPHLALCTTLPARTRRDPGSRGRCQPTLTARHANSEEHGQRPRSFASQPLTRRSCRRPSCARRPRRDAGACPG
jgi:hypothetical protein